MSQKLVSPQMSKLLDKIRRADRPAFHTMTAQQARQAYQSASKVLELPRAALVRVENLQLPAGDGAWLNARLYAPSRDVLPVCLYLHGGGFTIGNLEPHDRLCRQIALRSGAAVLALDYRLAPEHGFPCAVEGSCAALKWLEGHAAALGLDASRLAVAGDSAGGTLAAVAALHARDIGLRLLITPGAAAHADTPSHALFANGFLLEAEGIAWFFDQYIDRAQRGDWRFAPLHADDVEGVAPACVVLAECDPLVDEGLACADKLRAAHVPVELELYRGVTHDFMKLGRALPEAPAAQAVVGAALKAAFQREDRT